MIKKEQIRAGMFYITILGFVIAFLSNAICGELIYVARVSGAINPVSARYIERVLARAKQEEAECFVLELDTPGGLMNSMQEITKDFLNAEIPVVVYVSPSGARAASAGAFIAFSAHILAMAPGTRIGAAHPVTLGITSTTKEGVDSTMQKKVLNDAVAQIRSICSLRGRNEELAEEMVLESRSVSAEEAVQLDAIDIIAENLDTLIKTLDGWKVQLPRGAYMLSTRAIKVKHENMSPSEEILYTVLDPNIAYILMLVGIMGIFMEMSHPGAILPGVVGGISLLLALYAFQILPINYTGIILILFGILLLLLEIKVTSYGILTIGGISSMLIGSFMLTSGAAPSMRISYATILPGIILIALFFIFVVAKALLIQRKKVTTGDKGLIGELGVAISDIEGTGSVKVHGEYWHARSDEKILSGERVRVVDIDGIVLVVKREETR